jgi:hypothetical protein
MGHARPHPPTLSRTPGLLARLLRRCPCRYDRAPLPRRRQQWEWKCRFCPGIEPGGHRDGTATHFDCARVDFDSVWRGVLPRLSDADFDKWRYQRDATARKYAMWDARMKLPSGRSRCFRGAELTIAGVSDHIRAAHAEMA